MSVFPKTVFIPEKVPVVDSAKKSSNICPEQKEIILPEIIENGKFNTNIF